MHNLVEEDQITIDAVITVTTRPPSHNFLHPRHSQGTRPHLMANFYISFPRFPTPLTLLAFIEFSKTSTTSNANFNVFF